MSRDDVRNRHLQRRILNGTVCRDYRGKFVKGASGNPKGMTKDLREKYTKLRHDILGLVEDTNTIYKLRDILNSPNSLNEKQLKKYIVVLEKAIAILPKEQEAYSNTISSVKLVINEQSARDIRDKVAKDRLEGV